MSGMLSCFGPYRRHSHNADALTFPTDETRRSGRATKGQHTKDRETNDTPASSKKKGTAKKAAKKPVEEEEEPEDKVRCVCGEYEEETDIPRPMICCDNCEAWQHNDCMGLPEDYDSDHYFCEECKPENHKPLLAAMKKGQKPWEQVAKRRAELIAAEKASKGKKGKKGGRKSAVTEEVETPAATPSAGQKRKAEESPAPSETKVSPEARACETRLTTCEQTNNKKAKGTPQATPSAEPTTATRGRKAATSTPVSASPAPTPTPVPAPPMLPKDPNDLPQQRKGAGTSLVKIFTELTKNAVKDGFPLPANSTAAAFGANLGMGIEAALYDHSTSSANESETYKTQLSAIVLNIKRNAPLALRVIRNELKPQQLVTMLPAAMASEEQQRKDAEMQAQLDKQSTLVGTEEQGPRIRRTHKGEEYVEDLSKPAAETSEVKPQPQRQASTSEVKSPTHARRPPSVTIPNRRPSTDPRRQSSGNFDINNVYSTVQGSPVVDQRFGEIAQPSREPAGPGARPDADIDNLLKDEDEDKPMSSPPYSPRADNDDSVWRGLVNGGSVGRFHTGFKKAAGADIDAPTLRLTWDQLLPSEIGISGRIDPKKAEDYLCGLEFSNTSDLIVLWMNTPPSTTEATQFNQFFDYFKRRDRYGVGSQDHNPALKDIYFIPLEKEQQMPTFFSNLQTEFPPQAAERMILVPLVIKNSELPRNSVAESPAVGGAVMQTPITPRDNWQMDGAAANGAPPMGAYGYGTPVPVNGMPNNNAIGVPPPQFPQQHAMPPAFQPQGAFPNHLPQQQNQNLPPTVTPAQQAALKILGPQLSLAPAVQQLCQTAPTAGEEEMSVIKACIVENPAAAENLELLTQMLTQKWQANQGSGAPPSGDVAMANTGGEAATAQPAQQVGEAVASGSNGDAAAKLEGDHISRAEARVTAASGGGAGGN